MPDPTNVQETVLGGLSVPPGPSFSKDEYGCIRVGDSRVPLDVVLGEYVGGGTAQEILRAYPTLKLSDIERAITYFERNRDEVDHYLESRRQQADKLRAEIEASRVNRLDLLATLKARRESKG